MWRARTTFNRLTRSLCATRPPWRKEATVRWFYKLLHLLFLGRAISRGPTYLAQYEVRRNGTTYQMVSGQNEVIGK